MERHGEKGERGGGGLATRTRTVRIKAAVEPQGIDQILARNISSTHVMRIVGIDGGDSKRKGRGGGAGYSEPFTLRSRYDCNMSGPRLLPRF